MESPKLITMPPISVQCLSACDQVLLTNVFNAYENTCIVAKNTQFPLFPATKHTSLHTFFNEIALAFPIFIEYFKNIPEFINIKMDDKIRLLKNHFCISMYYLLPAIS